MTREQIQQKLSELQTSKEQTVAQVNAIMGAIAVCQEFLKAIDEAEAGPHQAQPAIPAAA